MSAADAPDDDDDGDRASTATGEGQRLDKWLWFVRVIKSRTQAAGLVTDGKVRLNRQRVDKPSQLVRPGDVVTVAVRGHIRVLKMLAAGQRRGPPAEARTLYEEMTPPPAPSLPGSTGSPSGARSAGQGRPTKKERRQLDRFRGDDN